MTRCDCSNTPPDKRSSLCRGPQVSRRHYKETEQTVPLLGFGMMRLPRISADKPDIDYAVTGNMIARALEAGINYFDTAYFYHGGLSEKCLGDLLSKYPRDSYYLADKMPISHAATVADAERIFNEQLSRCKTDYFDFYLLHAVNAGNWKKTVELGICEFLDEMKAAGKIRRFGFSFHDAPEVLRQVTDARPWDFVQIQLNYLDWELYRSKEQYEILTGRGIPAIIMEPLRGGALASFEPDVAAIFHNADPGAGIPSWALRYAGSLPNVLTVLSGMSLPEQLEENIGTFAGFRPLSDAERGVVADALALYRKTTLIPCTACRYCMPCPAGVDIPRIFGMYNQSRITRNPDAFRTSYGKMEESEKASACVGCGACLEKCPQKIDIPAELKKIAVEFK